jgi:phage baseplate assembly protein W
MATYLGFTTQNVCEPKTTNMVPGSAGGPGGIRQGIKWGNKFKLTDNELVIQDFVNALNIKKGTKVGQPNYGTSLWDMLFEPNVASIRDEILLEVRRIAGLDNRIILNTINVYSYRNGVLLEVEMAVRPLNEALIVKINLNRETNTANIV